MIRALALVVIFGTACGSAHLGRAYGKRTRAAFSAQAQGREAEAPGRADAADARRILSRHRGEREESRAPKGGGAAVVIPSLAPTTGAPASGGTVGTNGPIRLEAK